MDSPDEQKEWTGKRVQRFIDDQIQESLTLEYKAAAALEKVEKKKAEITKDVSAMANSDGGTIIYGLSEGQNHMPADIDPIDWSTISKEWLEQVIDGIRPRIDRVIIHPVQLTDSPDKVVYVVQIPRSTTAHQARDKRYYKRRNFKCDPMEDYEIRDVMNRATLPDADVEFSVQKVGGDAKGSRFMLKALVHNQGVQVITHFKLELLFPNLSLMYPEWSRLGGGIETEPLGEVTVGIQNCNLASYSSEEDYLQVVYRSPHVLFPKDRADTKSGFRLEYTVRREVSEPPLVLHWRLFADNMPFKEGQVPIHDLPITYLFL